MQSSSEQEQQQSQVEVPTKPRSINFREHKFPIENFIDLKSVDGKDLRIDNYRWPGVGTSQENPPKVIICMFHGYGSYVGKFAYVARFFAEKGYDVVGMDQKGFGHSEGTRGLIEDRDQFYQEGLEFVMKTKKYYEELYKDVKVPIFTLGYSQGGALALGVSRLMSESGDSIDGQIYVVPNFKVQQGHWTEDFYQQLQELSQDPTNHLAFPFKPLRDISFLMDYINDELQFKGPHFARTVDIVKQVSEKDLEHMKSIKHPVHVTVANDDQVLCCDEIRKFFDTVQTSDELKEKLEYDSDHYILSDGWLYEECISNQIKWLERVLPLISQKQ